jgi:zinc protease
VVLGLLTSSPILQKWGATVARRLIARPSSPWAGDLPVFQRVLGNGLKALVLPRKHAPVVVCDIYYPAGSFNEPVGRSGLAHYLEHMLFKGTARLPKGQIDRIAFAAAGQANAETGEDTTHYWFAFPSDRWELALQVESDRMIGGIFDPGEVEAERGVIAEERARDLESPFSRLDQAHLTASYVRHPYRNPIIGWPDDLDRIGIADLEAFYREHYRPDGAVVVVVGDVEPERALDRVEHHFGGLLRGISSRAEPAFEEPRQVGRRAFELLETESVARGILGWHTVPMGHPDVPALDVLSDLLTCGRRSRLWDQLVERERLVTWLDSAQESARRAGQMLIQVEATPRVDPHRIESEILAVIERLADDGPTNEELARSRNRLEAAWRWEQGDVGGLASGLGDVAVWGNWSDWQAQHRAAIAVEADDIRRVASAYLGENGLTVGWSLPKHGRAISVLMPGEVRPHESRPSRIVIPDRPLAIEVPSGVTTLSDFRPERMVLANGMRLLTERRGNDGVIALELFVNAGQVRELKPGLAYLTGRLLEEGTLHRTAEAMAEEVEDAGASLDVGPTGASLRVRAEDLERAIDWLADLTISPAFLDDSVTWFKRKIAAEYQSERDDPAFLADGLFRSLVYGRHPLGRDPRGSTRDIGRLDRDDVVDHHRRYFVPGNTFLVAVGDFDPKTFQRIVKRRFGAWSGAGAAPPHLPYLSRSTRPKVRRVSRPGEQVHLLIGHLGITRADADFDALSVLDYILGSGPGFTDRLSRIIRDELGLAYSVGGGIADSADLMPGLFKIYVGTGPDEAERALAAVREQVRAMHAGDFSDEEVENARRYLAGSWVFDYQTVEQRAGRLLELERWGLPLDEPLAWPGRIESVTPRDVRRAARVHINPEALVRVEYGPIRKDGQSTGAECA